MFDVFIVKHIAFAIEQVGQALRQLDHVEEWSKEEKRGRLRPALNKSLEALKLALVEAADAE